MAEEMKETAGAAQSQAMELSDFEKLLNDEFKPKSEEASQAVQGAVKTLLSQAMENVALIQNDSIATIEGIIA